MVIATRLPIRLRHPVSDNIGRGSLDTCVSTVARPGRSAGLHILQVGGALLSRCLDQVSHRQGRRHVAAPGRSHGSESIVFFLKGRYLDQ